MLGLRFDVCQHARKQKANKVQHLEDRQRTLRTRPMKKGSLSSRRKDIDMTANGSREIKETRAGDKEKDIVCHC